MNIFEFYYRIKNKKENTTIIHSIEKLVDYIKKNYISTYNVYFSYFENEQINYILDKISDSIGDYLMHKSFVRSK